MPQQKEEQKKKELSGKTIALYALGAGFGILALMKGVMSKSFSKLLDKWKISLEAKLAKDSGLKNFYRFALAKVNSFSSKLESINNFTTLKDVLVMKAMYGKNGNRTFTRRIHEGITNFFNRISRGTVNSSYAKTNRRFAGLNETMEAINERLLRENPNNPDIINVITAIRRRMSDVNKAFENGFGIEARNGRLRQINEATEGLYDYCWNASWHDFKNFKSKNMWQSFIADDYILPHKMKMSNETKILRQAITNDINDSYKASIEVFDNIQKFVKPTDKTANSVLNDLRNYLNQYRKLSGKDEIAKRAELNEKILKSLKRLSSSFDSSIYTSQAKCAIANYIKQAEEIISNNSKGELQEILTLYKQILPRKEYLQLKKQVQKTVKSLDNSIETETIKYFDKARDLKLGSAPTDIISILGAGGTLAWYIGKSKDKDERISATLKYGVPVIGGIATTLLCTAKLVAGSKSLAIGLASAWLMNKIGVVFDNARKQYSLDISLENKKKEVKEAVENLKPQSDKV